MSNIAYARDRRAETDLSKPRARPSEVSPAELRALVLGDSEVAVVDVREGDRYAAGHISVAVELPLSEIELRVQALLPRASIALVVVDEDGGALAVEAVRRLGKLGYSNAQILAGGNAGWAAAGNELITGLNSLSKALGEFVERNDHTPKINAAALKARIDAGEDLAIFDTRPLDEFRHISIPGGIAAPGAELLYRVFANVKSPTQPVVINCAGRTRAIIGAQALRNAGFPNPVVSLENGTSAWLLAGYEPGRGAEQQAARPTGAALERSKEAARHVAKRFGVRTITADQLDAFRLQRKRRSLYILDVRTAEEFADGHLPDARSAPGGQIVQATDQYIGARKGLVVLVDDADLVRATITASWLIQLGLTNVFVYGAGAAERAERGTPARKIASDGATPTIAPAELNRLLAADDVAVVDLEPAPPDLRERHYIPGSLVGRRSTLGQNLDAIPGDGMIILTSLDGTLARLAAAELAQEVARPVKALAGGTAAWEAAGFEVGRGLDQPSLDPAEKLTPAPTLEERRKNLAAYVRWGDLITDQLARDGLVQFRSFPA